MPRQAKRGVLSELLHKELLEVIPFNVAVIDRSFRVIAANGSFEEYFGNWRGKRCYEVYRGLCDPCPNCQANLTFQDGEVRVLALACRCSSSAVLLFAGSHCR